MGVKTLFDDSGNNIRIRNLTKEQNERIIYFDVNFSTCKLRSVKKPSY